jgi:hypothetical protein
MLASLVNVWTLHLKLARKLRDSQVSLERGEQQRRPHLIDVYEGE